MCEPKYFGVSYDINPWMTGNVGNVNHELACEQFSNLVEKIYSLGAKVKFVEPQKNLPDQVFTANAGLIVGKHQAIVSRFKHKERQPEEDIFNDALKLLDYETFQPTFSSGFYFEGAGDALYNVEKTKLFVGYGHRTDLGYANSLKTALNLNWNPFGAEVIPLKLSDPNYYHLDTCFCPLDNGHLLMNHEAFDIDSYHRIRKHYKLKDIVLVSPKSAKKFACNAISIGEHIILNDIEYDDKKQLNELGYKVHKVNLSEFMKAGGSAKCLTLEIK